MHLIFQQHIVVSYDFNAFGRIFPLCAINVPIEGRHNICTNSYITYIYIKNSHLELHQLFGSWIILNHWWLKHTHHLLWRQLTKTSLLWITEASLAKTSTGWTDRTANVGNTWNGWFGVDLWGLSSWAFGLGCVLLRFLRWFGLGWVGGVFLRSM